MNKRFLIRPFHYCVANLRTCLFFNILRLLLLSSLVVATSTMRLALISEIRLLFSFSIISDFLLLKHLLFEVLSKFFDLHGARLRLLGPLPIILAVVEHIQDEHLLAIGNLGYAGGGAELLETSKGLADLVNSLNF